MLPPAHRRLPLLRYRRLRGMAVALLVAEFVVGMAGYATPRREIFPFASWFLFLLVPHHTKDYDLILRSSDGHPVDPPLPYSQLPSLVNNPHSIVTYNLVQQFGDAQANHDSLPGQRSRQQIDALFRQPHVQYDLVRNTYEPIERFETGRVRTRETLASFTAGGP